MASAQQPTFYGPATFRTHENTLFTPAPLGLAVGDLLDTGDDADWLEVAVANRDTGDVAIFRNTRDWSTSGSPPSPTNGLTLYSRISVGGPPHDVAIADMDNDGHDDVVVSVNSNPPKISILYGNGAGSFNKVDYTMNSNVDMVFGLTIGEFNNNAHKDVAVGALKWISESSRPRAHFLHQVAAGTFVQQTETPPETDFPGDSCSDAFAVSMHYPAVAGRSDVIFSMEYGYVFTLINGGVNSNGTVNWTLYQTGSDGSFGIAAAKFRPGKNTDVVLATIDQSYGRICWNDGTWNGTEGLVQRPETYSVLPLSTNWGIAAGRINRDVHNDVVIVSGGGSAPLPYGGIAILAGTGNGTFSTPNPPYTYAVDTGNTPPRPRGVILADMNRDGLNDVLVSCFGSQNLGVLVNNTPP